MNKKIVKNNKKQNKNLEIKNMGKRNFILASTSLIIIIWGILSFGFARVFLKNLSVGEILIYIIAFAIPPLVVKIKNRANA